jgi:hypothetical protein
MIKQTMMSLFGSLDVAKEAQPETPQVGDSQGATKMPMLMKFGLKIRWRTFHVVSPCRCQATNA